MFFLRMSSRVEAQRIVLGLRFQKTRFSTGREEKGGEEKHVGDNYFLESGDKIRFFFEVYIDLCFLSMFCLLTVTNNEVLDD